MKRAIDTYTLLSGVLIISIGLFLCLTVRRGHNWDGDFALYIMNARNIVEHLPYSHTGFIANPLNPINPAAYPPGLPLLLAPVYWLSGVNLDQMKLVGIASFVLTLVLFARIARLYLSRSVALAATAAVGLHPYIWEFKDTIYSELPFMFFCYASLYYVHGLNQAKQTATPMAVLGAATALAMAYLTRSVGGILFPVALLSSLVASRRLINPVTVAIVIGAAISVLVQVLLPSDLKTYFNYFGNYDFHTFIHQAFYYTGAVAALLGGKVVFGSLLLTYGLILMSAGLALLGFVTRIRERISVFDIFFVIYALFLLVYPIQEDPARYSLPIWPIVILYIFIGAESAARVLGHADRQFVVPVALCAVLAALYGLRYSKEDFGPIPFSVTDSVSNELFASIRDKLPADAILVARKPTIIALFGGRRAATWPAHFSDLQLLQYMHSIRASYIVQDTVNLGGIKPDVPDELDAFIERKRAALTPVFSNKWFNVFEVSHLMADHIENVRS